MKLNEFNIEKAMLDYQSHKFDEMKEIVNETIKENETLKNTIDIQKIKIDMLEKEKQQLISWLEDKIKECMDKKEAFIEGLDNLDLEIDIMKVLNQRKVYQEVMDFVNKGGKDD